MKIRTNNSFKVLFVIGLIFLFTSMFLDWYLVQIFDDNNALIGNWTYNLFIEWSNDVTSQNVLVEWLKPANLQIPLFIHLLFIGVIIGSALFGLEFSFIVFMPLAIIYVHFYWKMRNKFVDKWTKIKKK